MTDDLFWRNRIVESGAANPQELAKGYNSANWRSHPQIQREALEEALDSIGVLQPVLFNRLSGKVIDGHLRIELAILKGQPLIPVNYVELTDDEEAFALATLDAITEQAQPIPDKLAALLERTREMTAERPGLRAMLEALKERAGINGNGHEAKDAEPQIDKAKELQAKWSTALGQVWEMPSQVDGRPHRVVCGDCTDRAVVEAVMKGERAVLCHADPPYGMGKENEGIANDNLYREKLDAFQTQWWGVGRPYLEDNASAYIWGNADDLWRLWYCGGLRNSERLTFRNEIIWDKGNGQGIGSEDFRSYAPTTERVLFFMLGEQGFNNNADNYWEGWEPIREYLKSERDKMGWDNAKCKTLAGHSPTSGCHWFDASQWIFVTEDVYTAWQSATNGQAFRRDYDTLRRDFYATRAYFDNTHENMTDVWRFPRVQGDDRWGHATPKPVEMIERIVNSSSPSGAIIYSPFLGSGTDLIAAHNLHRIARGIELDPGYVGVVLERYYQAFGIEPKLLRE